MFIFVPLRSVQNQRPPDVVHRKISDFAHKCANRLHYSFYHIITNSFDNINYLVEKLLSNIFLIFYEKQ